MIGGCQPRRRYCTNPVFGNVCSGFNFVKYSAAWATFRTERYSGLKIDPDTNADTVVNRDRDRKDKKKQFDVRKIIFKIFELVPAVVGTEKRWQP
jgi:hypothetical protein